MNVWGWPRLKRGNPISCANWGCTSQVQHSCGFRLRLRCARKHCKSMSLGKWVANPCQWWLNILRVGSFWPLNLWLSSSSQSNSIWEYTPFLSANGQRISLLPPKICLSSIDGHIKTRDRHGRKDLPRNASLGRS